MKPITLYGWVKKALPKPAPATVPGSVEAPATVRSHLARPACARSIDDETLCARINVLHAENYGVYGVRKIRAALAREGRHVAKNRVARLIDEPAYGLDPVGMRWMRELLRSFADAGGPVLMSSHLLADAQQTIDHVLIVDGGRLMADAPVAELVSPGHSLEDVYLGLVNSQTVVHR